MKIESEKFKDIQIALLKKQLHNASAEGLHFKLQLALAAAGLDPDKNYNMNEIDMTITEIQAQKIETQQLKD